MKTIQIRQGNDTPLVFALHHADGTPLDLATLRNLKLTLIHEDCQGSFAPPHRITQEGAVTLEFNAGEQALGFYHLHIEGDIPSEGFHDKLRHIAYRKELALQVLPVGETTEHNPFVPLRGYLTALVKGDKGEPLRFEDLTPQQIANLKGEPGDPTELLHQLSQQQANELQNISNRLSQEQRDQLMHEQHERTSSITAHLERKQSQIISQVEQAISDRQKEQLMQITTEVISRMMGVDQDGRLTISGTPVGPSLIGPQGLTPEIRDGFWWIGDEYTGVLAEAKKLSAKEWLLMSKLTVQRSPLADYILYQPREDPSSYTAQDVLDFAQGKRQPNPAAQPRTSAAIAGSMQHMDARTWNVVHDISKYGKNIIIRIKAQGTIRGYISIYWKEGQSWEVVTEELKNEQEVTVSAKIENASGPVVVLLKNSDAWASQSIIKEVDIYSSSDEQIDVPVLTWLARPRDPKTGDVILVSNIASRGERIRLEYNGTGWALPWGAIISGATTNEARQSYTAAIISRMINPHDITVAT